MFLKIVLCFCLITRFWAKGTPTPFYFESDSASNDPLKQKSSKQGWDISSGEKYMNKHSLILIPEDQYHHRFKRSVSYDGKLFHSRGHSVHVRSEIRYRYAVTLISSNASNPDATSTEVYMSIILPEAAFISKFAIQIDDHVYVAYVKEKEDAWMKYQDLSLIHI